MKRLQYSLKAVVLAGTLLVAALGVLVLGTAESTSAKALTSVETGANSESVQISKDGPASVLAGDLITYTLEILNSTSITLTEVVITDTIPTGAHYVAGGTLVGDVVSWTVPSLKSGVTIARKFSVTANATITNDDYRVSSNEGYSAIGQDVVVTYVEHRVYLPIVVKPCIPLFADNFENPASGWPVGDNGNIRREYTAGEYRKLIRDPGWRASSRPGSKARASNYVAAVDVRNGSGSFGSAGLLFGLSTSDWSQFYVFEVFWDGFYAVWKYGDEGWTELASGSSSHIRTGMATNRLMILRDDSLIKAYANGGLLTTVFDNSYVGSRDLGLIVFSYDQPNVDVYFDNFAIYPTYCNPVVTDSGMAAEASFTALADEVFLEQNYDSEHWRER